MSQGKSVVSSCSRSLSRDPCVSLPTMGGGRETGIQRQRTAARRLMEEGIEINWKWKLWSGSLSWLREPHSSISISWHVPWTINGREAYNKRRSHKHLEEIKEKYWDWSCGIPLSSPLWGKCLSSEERTKLQHKSRCPSSHPSCFRSKVKY